MLEKSTSLSDTRIPGDEISSISSPLDIISKLKKCVISQNDAIHTVALGLYEYIHSDPGQVVNNTLFLAGPSGSGKTHLAICSAQVCGLEYAIIDSSHITPEGFSGDSVSDAIEKRIDDLLWKSKNRKCVIIMDEPDKLRHNKK